MSYIYTHSFPSTSTQRSRKFGFTNLSLLREDKENGDCRGEEHEVELLWSVQSGKKRIFWNGVNISHFFREDQLFEQVHFSWETRSGETFRIVAFEKPRADGPQYDLLIDGRSFFSLPLISQLRLVDVDDVASDVSVSSSLGGEHISTDIQDSWDEKTTACIDTYTGSLYNEDLSLVSVDRCSLADDLTSELVSKNLDSLRNIASMLIPGVDDLISRAIVNAFSEDRSSGSFSIGSLERSVRPPIHIESSMIWDTISWIRLNVEYAPRPDVEDQKRLFLQKQIDAIFTHVHHDNLGEEAAIRVLCGVSELLGFEIKKPLRRDTVMIHELNMHVEEDDLVSALRVFGEVIDAHISKVHKFGLCRFSNEESATKVVAACADGTFHVNGETPFASLISPHTGPASSSRGLGGTDSRTAIPQPSLRRRSHQRNSITIDTSSPAAPFLIAGESTTSLMSLQKYSNILQPHVFVNIPARAASSLVIGRPSAVV